MLRGTTIGASWQIASLRVTRGHLRLWSSLILLAFVVCHLTAHSFLIIPIDRADAALKVQFYALAAVPELPG